jgi:putative transposase
MGRALRVHLPGSAFHIVARTQGREPWFSDDIKAAIADALLRGAASAGARPVAFAVMDTHFHLIIYQGVLSLGETMQPIMRRIALVVQKRHDLHGHVFERRYRAKVCRDAEHLPNAILYVHRNPVKARVCRTATDYLWSSAKAYDGSPPGLLCGADGLRAFDPDGCASLESSRSAYRERLARVSDDELDGYWNWFWNELRRPRRDASVVIPRSPHSYRAGLADVRDVALEILRTIDNTVDVELVRSRYGGRKIAAIRKQLIAGLLQRGYAGVQIARYLRISETLVSRVKSAMRWGSLAGM